MTERPRRARPAAATRILAGGVSVSALLAMVGGIARAERTVQLHPQRSTAQPAPPPIVRVVVRVHHRAPAAAGARTPAFVVPPPQPAIRRVVIHRTRPVTTSHGSR